MKKISSFLAVLIIVASSPLVAQTIGGHLVVCLGASRTTLTISTSGGAWSSGDVSRATIDAGSGEVTGVAGGTATISYTIAPSTVFTAVVTVNAISMNPINVSTGGGSLCTGGSPVTCSITPMWGNAWSSSTPAVATVNTGGLVTPTSTVGTAIITYRHGYGNCDVTREISVNPTPTVSITSPMCNASLQTATAIPAGGTWTSSSAGVASINSSTGDINSHAAGSAYIYYTSADGCVKLTFLSVISAPGAITGTLTTCMGSTTTLSSTTSGGVWTSGTPAVATIGAGTGIVTPVSAGTSVITYTPGTGCERTAIVTVNAALTSNTGSALICVGQTSALANATSGGTWSSSATAKATVGYYTGVVTGISAGTANITYRVGSGCTAITEVTLNAVPAAISGTTNVCVGETITLSHAVSGGTWSSSNPSTATIDISTGIVTGVASGVVYMSYTVSPGCYRTLAIIVRPLPAAISGSMSLCPGSGAILTDGTTGGTWSSSNTAVATIGSTNGLLIAVSTGTTTITYRVTSTGCIATATATIGTGPDAGTITGPSTVDIGSTISLTNAAGGGTWMSSSTVIATVGTSGIVTGVAAGTANITYTVANSCGIARATKSIAVSTATTVAPITGTLTISPGATTALSNAISGGIWTSSNSGVATIGSTSGILTGVSAGTATITYTALGSPVTALVTVYPWLTLYGNRHISKSPYGQDIAIGSCNVPYLTFASDLGVAVKKYDGNKFVPLGGILSAGANPSIAVGPDGTPFVAYIDATNSNKATVKKYDGSAWVTVGSAGFSAGGVGFISIAMDTNGNAHVAYEDLVNSNKITVMKYNGSSWSTMGGAGFAGTNANYTSLAFDGSGVPYVAFMNSDYTADVMKFNGSTWDEIGTPGTIGADGMVDLAVDSAGIPYIALISGYQAFVRRYTGAYWESVGDFGSPEMGHGYISIKMGQDNLPWVALQGSFTPDGSCCGTGYEALKFNGYSWVKKGNEIYYGGGDNSVSIAIDDNSNPYMACREFTNEVVAGRLQDNEWTYLNGESYSAGHYGSVRKLLFAADGTPYLAYNALFDFTGAPVVEKYNGNTWVSARDTGEIFPGYLSTSWANSVDIAFSPADTLYAAFTLETGTLSFEVRKLVENNWVPVGGTVEGSFREIDIEIDSAGVPYVAYFMDGYNTIGVKKFVGGDWVDVLDSGFVPAEYYATLRNPSLGFGADNSVYVGFQINNSVAVSRGSVVRFDGSHWVPVGPEYCTADTTLYFEMKMAPDHTPYIIYSETSNAYRATVKKYDGSNWVAVGSEGFTPAQASFPSLAFDSAGQPVVSFGDELEGGKLTVMKFDGSSWVTVGTGLSDAEVINTSVAVAPDGTLHVAYTHVYPYPSSETTGYTFGVKKFGSPTYIYGNYSICQGSSKQIDVNGGGNWSSSDLSVATVNCVGLVTGISAGTVAITYTFDSFDNTVIVTVNAAPDAGTLTGADSVMIGDDIMLSATVSGGLWSSANTPIATVGSASGIVSGIISGTATITYSVTGGGCTSSATHPVIVWSDGSKPGRGVTTNTDKPVFSIAPNPTTGTINVATGVNGKLMLHTIDGRIILTNEITKGTNKLSLPDNTAPGIYMLRFRGDDGSSKVVRLVYER